MKTMLRVAQSLLASAVQLSGLELGQVKWAQLSLALKSLQGIHRPVPAFVAEEDPSMMKVQLHQDFVRTPVNLSTSKA